MKKFLSLILCAAVVLTTGCSGVSQEEYNSLLEENSRLQEENNELNEAGMQLLDEISTLKSDADQLKAEMDKPQTNKDDVDNCFKIYTKMLSLPKSAISEVIPRYSSGIYEEDTFYNEKGELSAKAIVTFDGSLSAKDITSYIKAYIDGIQDGADQLFQSSLTAQVFIFRYDNGNVIMSQCWYKEDDGTIRAPMFFTSYGEDVAKELTRLYQEDGVYG